MNTKKLVFMALLIAVGATLYIVIPGINGGMKPDFMLTMMIIGILLFPDVKSVFLLAVTTGLISGLFSSFPGGFIPNVIDKFITAFIIYAVVRLVPILAKKTLGAVVVVAIGTMISGSIFLSIAMLVLGFDVGVPFYLLFATVVLPAAALNSIATFIMQPLITGLMQRTSLRETLAH